MKHNQSPREKSFHAAPAKSGLDAGSPEMSFGQRVWEGFRFFCGNGRSREFIVNRVEAESLARARFAAMLRDPFPGMTDAQIAAEWAPRLQCSERTVRNWLARTHTASGTDMMIVGATLGIWRAAQVYVGEMTRNEWLAAIGQRNGR